MKDAVRRILAAYVCLALASCGGDATEDNSPAPRLLAQTVISDAISLGGNRADYTISISSGQYSFTDQRNATKVEAPSTLKRVDFADISLALDIDGKAGQIFRLYQAAFNRTPDLSGVGFWLAALDNGITLEHIADEFIRSAEFQLLYGSNTTVDDFVTKLYFNTLHRSADPSGRAFWRTALENGTARASVLVDFSESTENKVATAPLTQNGIAYVRPGLAYRPVARSGAGQTVKVGGVVILDGSSSSDANGDQLKYSWTLAKPTGSIAALSSTSVERPTFIPDLAGTYTLTLSVTDGKLAGTAPSTTTVFASAPTPIIVADTGVYKCTTITHSFALTLFAEGHIYLDRDHDGKPCEATDVSIEYAATVPVSGKQCYVNGYTRANGTRVSGYWRRC